MLQWLTLLWQTLADGDSPTPITLNSDNVSILSRANRQGFTVNASTESLDRADHAMALGLPAVTVVRNDQPVPTHTHRLEIAWWSVQHRLGKSHVLSVASAPKRTALVS